MLRVPVTAQEREMIELKMQQMGTRCFSVYALKMLIDGYVIKIDYSDIKAMTAELQKIGTNTVVEKDKTKTASSYRSFPLTEDALSIFQ